MTDKNLSELITSSYTGGSLINDTANTTSNIWSAVKISNEIISIGNTAYANAVSYVDAEIGALINSAPGVLDTLNELAAAINNDPTFVTTIITSVNDAYTNAVAQIANGTLSIETSGIATGNTLFGANESSNVSITIDVPATDLSLIANGSTILLESSTGTDVNLLSANSTTAGLLSAEAQTIAGDKTFTGTISYTGTINSDFIPDLDITYDLGSANNRWRDIFLSGNTINLGDAKITTDETSGTIALIPPVTASNPHPSAMVINALGRMKKVETTAGILRPESMDAVANTTDDTFESITVEQHVIANTFVGDGSSITNVDAITLQGNTVADLRQYADNAAANVSVDLTGYATETYVDTAVSGIVNAAPTTLDTLNELAAALGDDPNFATTITNLIGTKLDTSTWTGSAASSITSTNVTNWNTAYGWGNHASAGYQAAASAITTSNIGSQSVNYAASAGSVAWSNISADARRNYSLQFRPNSGDYAGFQFLNDAGSNAGYLLVRSTASDNFPPYTAGGITLVSDVGGLNFFARTGTQLVRMGVGNSETFRLESNYSLSLNSSRAPIFYDSNDTGYYVDPASTSNIWRLQANNKYNLFGASSNWDSVGFTNLTNVHMQGHNQFWFGAGNGTWFTGTANQKSQASGLAADASRAHDLLITTMQSTSTYDRGITFAVDNTGAGISGWRLGKWHSGDARDSSKLVVDGQIFAKAGYTDEYDYYSDDYSAYYSAQGGSAHWSGDTNAGWHVPGIVTSSAIQIQSGNAGTNSRKPQIQFHQYGYGGPGIEYDGPNKAFTFGELGSSTQNRLNSIYYRFGGGQTYVTINTDYLTHTSDIRAPIFYDSNDTGRYVDPNGSSQLGEVYATGWLRNYGSRGLYNQTYARGIWAVEAAGNSYGNYANYDAGRNNWAGWALFDDCALMGRSNLDFGLHDNTFGWAWYWNYGNNSLGIGTSTTSSSYRLYVDGQIYATSNITAYSDVRKKENIVTIDSALEKLTSMRGVYYNKIDDETKKRQIGVIAQEVNEILPEVVTYAEDIDEYGVSYGNIVGLLIEAIKEQQLQIEELKRRK